jgi:hypothetical protein
MLGHLQGIIDLNTQIPHCRFDLAVTQKQLDRPQILGLAVDQRRLGPAGLPS